jgi:hypothetical protein
MVTRQERARLLEAYRDEPVYGAEVMLKSSAWLLLVAGLAISGAAIDLAGHDAGRPQAQRHDNAINVRSAN